MKISDLLKYSAHRAPDRTALWFEERTLSYRELYEKVCRLANGLRRLAQPGDRVAILSENHPEYVLCYYGVPLSGAGLVFLNYRLATSEIIDILDDARPTVVITEPSYLETARAARTSVDSVHTIVCVDAEADDLVPFDDLIDTESAQEIDVPDDELAWLIYTSGTTGRAKGAALSHRNVVAAACNSAMSWEPDAVDDVITLLPWPLCHIAGYNVLVSHLRLHKVILMRRYDPEAFLALVQRHRVTNTTVAPTMLAMLLRHESIDAYDISSITRIGYGSAPMPSATLLAAMKRFPDAGFQTGFGMTELAGNALYHNMADHVAAADGRSDLLGSAGRSMGLSAARVVDDAGNELPRGEVGELVVQGEQVAMRYWNRPDATEESFRDGWLHSGDLAHQDEQGYVYIVDRKKDMVLTGGENVYSREVEEVLHQHPAVATAAVVGQPDELWGEVVVAVIEPNRDSEVDGHEVREFCAARIARYKCPRRVVEVSELPRNTVGKILKRQLRDMLSAEVTAR